MVLTGGPRSGDTLPFKRAPDGTGFWNDALGNEIGKRRRIGAIGKARGAVKTLFVKRMFISGHGLLCQRRTTANDDQNQ